MSDLTGGLYKQVADINPDPNEEFDLEINEENIDSEDNYEEAPKKQRTTTRKKSARAKSTMKDDDDLFNTPLIPQYSREELEKLEKPQLIEQIISLQNAHMTRVQKLQDKISQLEKDQKSTASTLGK
jgi:hypothetical protein